MCELLNSSDFEMRSRSQVLNLKFLRDNLKKNDRLEHPLLKLKTDIRLKMNGHPLLKMQTDIRLRLMKHSLIKMGTDIHLQLSRVPFLKNQLVPIHAKPP